MALTVEEIHGLYREHGHVAYSGEPVTQLEHALQSGLLAEEAGADEALVAAAFLHDLGHLLNRQGETPSARGIDDLAAVMQPGLRALLSLTAKGQDTTSAALTLWREFHTARSAILRLLENA